MAQRIEPPLRSPKIEQPSQTSRKLHPDAAGAPSTRPHRNTFKPQKTISFIVSFVVMGLIIYKSSLLDEPVKLWVQHIKAQAAATFSLLKNGTMNTISEVSRENLSANISQENLLSQADWISEARNNFSQLSASDRERIQKWLANNYGYNGALDGLWGPRTEASFLRARSTHDDVDRLFMTAIRETPTIRQVTRPTTQTVSPTNAQQELQNRIIQLRAACSISPRGSVGEQSADQQLYILTGERCARPPPVFQPIAPIQPNVPTRCTTLPRWSHLPRSLENLEIYCQ